MNDRDLAIKPRILVLGFRRFSELVHSVIGGDSNRAHFSFHDSVASSKMDYRGLVDRYHPDVIISAGANAAYLSSTLAVPVVSQPVRDADIILACLKAKRVAPRIHLFTYADPGGAQAQLMTHLSDFLGVELIHRHYFTSDEASEQFYLSLSEKPDVVVGPSFSCHLAEQEGIPSILLYSRESAEEMIESALMVAQRSLVAARQQSLQRRLLEQSDDMILFLDSNNAIIEANQRALENLGVPARLNSALRKLWHLNDIQTLHTERWVTVGQQRWLQVVDPVESNDHLLGYLVRYRAQEQDNDSQSYRAAETNFVVRSPKMGQVASLAKTYAMAHGAILIMGESGTGKEHIARQIHRHSRYADCPMIAVNCGSLPSELFESEMFGYEDGAFTNSRRGGYRGLLEQADGGVLFLDEVAEMPLAHQSKLLRVLQDKVLRPIGSDRTIRLDFKVVAATNRPLFEDVREGLFREDLYYRLNTFALELPPLRERKEDISALSVHYLTAYCRQYGLDTEPQRIYDQLAPHFERYRWPGNVRELESFCERVAVALLAEASPWPTEALIKGSLPELFREGSSFAAAGALKLNERSAIEHAMVMFDGDRQAVAEHLGISTTTLWRRLKAIDKE